MVDAQLVYISGPMTGYPENNYPAFNRAARALRGRGFIVMNPAENPACDDWAGYMRLAIAQLVEVDMVHTLPGWENSRGARIEVELARELGIPIVDLLAAPAEIDYSTVQQ